MKRTWFVLAVLVSIPTRGEASVLRYDFSTTSLFVAVNSGGLGPAWGVTFGPDNHLYVGDVPADAIRKYDGNTGAYIETFIASGSGGLDRPRGIAFGPDGSFWVSSANTDEILRYNGTTGAFLGASTALGLDFPYGLTFGPDGHIYVCSHLTATILRFNGATGAFMGTFVSAGGGLNRPTDLQFMPGPAGDLLVSSGFSDAVLRFDGTTGAAKPPFVTPQSGGLRVPQGLAYGADGNLYVASSTTAQIKRYHGVTGAFLGNILGTGIQYPNDIVAPPPAGPAPADGQAASGVYFVSSSEPELLPPNPAPSVAPWALVLAGVLMLGLGSKKLSARLRA